MNFSYLLIIVYSYLKAVLLITKPPLGIMYLMFKKCIFGYLFLLKFNTIGIKINGKHMN